MADGHGSNCNEAVPQDLLMWVCDPTDHPADNLRSLASIVGFVGDAINDQPTEAFTDDNRDGAFRILRTVAACLAWQAEQVERKGVRSETQSQKKEALQ